MDRGRGMERLDDDFAMQVSDLRTGRVIETPLTRLTSPLAPATPPPGGAAGEAAPAAEALATEPLVSGAPPRRPAVRLPSKRLRAYAAVALLLLVGAAMLWSVPATRQRFGLAVQGSTPTATAQFPVNAGAFYIVRGVPWGTLTVDGRPLDPPSNGTPTTLPKGRHTLEYRAAPFPPVRCRVTVPSAGDDTCPEMSPRTGFGQDMGAARMIDLGLTPARLPPDQYARLVQAVAGSLQGATQPTVVAPGDHYLGPQGTAAIASQHLQATLTFTLNTDPTRWFPSDDSGRPCVSLCDNLGGPGGMWLFNADVVARWRFTGADGSVVPTADNEVDTQLPTAAAWTSKGWTINAQPLSGYSQFCRDAFNAAFNGIALTNGATTYESSAQAPNLANGCADVVRPSGGVPATSPVATATPLPPDAALFIYRLGVVLAGSPAAHAARPQLPLATTYERALALQWLQNPS
jgi:hypothetical protein